MEDRFLNEAVRIADRLVDMAIPTENGVCWESLNYSEGKTSWAVSDSMYSGTAGIAFFLLELYTANNDEKYLKLSLKAADELWHKHLNNQTDYYAFFTGRQGFTHLFLKCHEITGDQSFKDKAVEVSLAAMDALNQGSSIDDLINGYAGTIVSLLYVHEKTKDDRILPVIEAYSEKLLDKAAFGKYGVYWDRASTQIRGLCGFSHGTAGIGYAYLQLGYYFDNPAFYFLAEMAFAYENQFYNPKAKNWPDFRKGFYDEDSLKEFKEAYGSGDKQHFKSSGNMKAWCHGSPGVGFSRVSAAKILGDKYLPDLKNAVLSTVDSLGYENDASTYTLCHGVGGNSLLLFEAKELLPELDYTQLLEDAADQAIKQFDTIGFYYSGLAMHRDGGGTSLFMGDAGVGYFMLALSQQYKETILKPQVHSQYGGELAESSFLNISKSAIIDKVAKKRFPETWSLYGNKADVNQLTPENLNAELISFLQGAVAEDKQGLLNLEIKVNELDTVETGNAYLYIRQVVELEKTSEILKDEANLRNIEVYLPEENILFEVSDEDLRLIIPTSEGVTVHDLNFFTYLIMSLFQEPNTIDKAVAAIVSEYEVEDEQQMVNTVTEQVRQALLSGIMFVKH
ncbi:MAG: lanthionine synthetase LanC family protein [Bacteroidota bacterium]